MVEEAVFLGSAVGLQWSYKIQKQCYTFLNSINLVTLVASSQADKERIKSEPSSESEESGIFKCNGSQKIDDFNYTRFCSRSC